MSDFKAKMHQNPFRLGLCPRPRWESLLCSLRPDRSPSWNKDDLHLREEEGCRKGTEGQREEGRGRERRGSEGRGRLKFSLE